MITLDELWQYLLEETGQSLFEGLPEITYDQEKFKRFVQSVLSVYSKYCPVERSFNITVTGLRYDFTNHEHGVPEWLSKVMLVSYPWGVITGERRSLFDFKLTIPPLRPWIYRKPVLYVSVNGVYDVIALYNHEIQEDDSGNYYIETINHDDDLFLKLLTGRFLQRIGRARRAFTLNELPITSDAAEIIAEGKEMETEVLEALGELGKWYVALS